MQHHLAIVVEARSAEPHLSAPAGKSRHVGRHRAVPVETERAGQGVVPSRRLERAALVGGSDLPVLTEDLPNPAVKTALHATPAPTLSHRWRSGVRQLL